jgi:uncharacterized membrane protein
VAQFASSVSPFLRDLLDLLLRWVHLVAGVMWVGNSLLFNWLDRNLYQPATEQQYPGLQGKIWLLHSGAFYEVDKKLLQPPARMPAMLHWFKWQSYTTWLTGVSLLIVVYYFGGAAMLVDVKGALSGEQAQALGLGTVVGGFALYELLWRSPLKRWPRALVPVTLGLFGALVWLLTHFLSGRAAYIHTGVLLGTCMSGNVLFHIMPSQRALVRTTEAGRAQDPAIQSRAKQRSIHNNYLTFPLLFLMVSNHFPSTFGNGRSDLVLWALLLGGAGVRHFMNMRFTSRHWAPALAVVVVLSVGAVIALTRPAAAAPTGSSTTAAPVSFMQVAAVIERRCRSCHATHPTDDTLLAAPAGVRFETPADVKAFAARIRERVVVTATMPLGNKTGITDDERALLGRWVDQGAPID